MDGVFLNKLPFNLDTVQHQQIISDIPINVVGVNDASPVIAYLFLLAFVFLIGKCDIL